MLSRRATLQGDGYAPGSIMLLPKRGRVNLPNCLTLVGCLVGSGFSCLTAAAAGTSAVPTSHYERPTERNGPFRDRVIVFVHGIFGDANGTWRSLSGVYWPKLLLSDRAFDDYDIYVANYKSPIL